MPPAYRTQQTSPHGGSTSAAPTMNNNPLATPPLSGGRCFPLRGRVSAVGGSSGHALPEVFLQTARTGAGTGNVSRIPYHSKEDAQ